MKTFTREEVGLYNGILNPSIYLIIHEKVYDVTEYRTRHPGKEKVMLKFAGKDASEAFEALFHSSRARSILPSLCVGFIEN